MISTLRITTLLTSMLIFLTACGGGGGSSGGADTTAPVITLNGDNPMTLVVGAIYNEPDATAVDDVDGNIPVVITGSVDTSTVGTYSMTYTATDSSNNTATKTRVVNITNTAPVANAGEDQSVHVGDTVTLDGSSSSDSDNHTLTYKWSFTSLPLDSTTSLSNDTAEKPTFVANVNGTYVLSLIVNDGTVDSSADSVTVYANTMPLADAGADQNVLTSSIVTLDGSGSSDADNDNLTYSWNLTSKPTGSNATLSNITVTNPTFTADIDGTYIIQLIVNDGTENSNADSVTITSETDTRYDTINYDEGIYQ